MQIKSLVCTGCKQKFVDSNKLMAMSKGIKREMFIKQIEFNKDIEYYPCPHCGLLNMVNTTNR